jgi:flavin reductase (DIM6/NTAB) family NADH-FMN oxidoreductase RutF/DNA-binding IclR family transcriptional regulator
MANSTEVPSRGATEVNDPAQFRYVLGQYPTGVTLITAAHPGGEPVGMVVGTFTSVSLDPPIVAFLPDRKSSSWPKIREAGSFCANVLTSAQQDICRAFARKQDDRFTSSRWETTASGSPRLQGAAAWIDCTIDDVITAGDHHIVLGRVQGLGVGDSAELPLLFLRGGYGSFSIPSIQSLNLTLPRHLRAVDAARLEIEVLAVDLNLECLTTVTVEDTVVVASAAGVESSPSGAPNQVGTTFPLAAPLTPEHVAWAGEDAERRWLDGARQLLGPVDAAVAHQELVTVRARGYAVSAGSALATEWSRSVDSASDTGKADFTGVMRQLLARAEMGANEIAAANHVASLQVPVFGADGQVALALVLNGFNGKETTEQLHSCLDRLQAAAARISSQLGGSVPIGGTASGHTAS